MPEHPGSGGLDAATLAAYLDGQLPPESRAKVEAEIAADPDAYEWLVHTVGTIEEIEAAGSQATTGPAVLPFYRRRGVRAAIGVALAAAAALVLVVQLQPEWWRRLRGTDVDPRFEKLVAAVGEERYIEGRLSGGFKYGPLRSLTRGPGDLSNQNLALLAAAGELEKAAQADPSAENLQAWGVAQVLLGDAAGAARSLAAAAAMAPQNASVRSDLSAVLAALGRANDDASSWEASLTAADAALALGSDPEALYNRCVALRGLGRHDLHAECVDEYSRLDPGSNWAREIRGLRGGS